MQAFAYAKDILLDGLAALEARKIESPLFDKLRMLLSSEFESRARIYFDSCYYLINMVRRYFASRTIGSKVDGLDFDPFADGSASVDDYTASIYVFGERGSISPVRYSLSSLYKNLSGEHQLGDTQWLTAWNYMVISS